MIRTIDNHTFWLIAGIGILGTVYFFIRAFVSLYKKRMIEDTPTSLLRSAAQGYVELIGRGVHIDGPPILAPLSGQHCLWYRISCEELSRSSRNLEQFSPNLTGLFNLLSRSPERRCVHRKESDDLFYLDDDTGRCVIDPEGAKITPTKVQTWYGNSPVPDRGPALGGSPIGYRYRYKEELLLTDDILYVIGDLQTIGGVITGLEIEGEIIEVLHEWKNDKDTLLEKFDSNNDGEIDILEWNKARRKAKQEVAEKHALSAPEPVINIMKDPKISRRPYLISSKPLPDLVRRYTYKSIIFFFISLLSSGILTWAINIRL